MKAQTTRQAVKGFALIATISVLLLLTMVAVAFLSLAQLTVKTSRFEWAQEEARANARLGLMIAIGELQRDLGPDQRISVSASILDSDPESLQIDGVANQQWTGVMSTVYDQNRSGSPFTRDMSNGGLRDARNGTDYKARDYILNYIVSGNEGGKDKLRGGRPYLDARTENLQIGDEAIEIVSRGSVRDPNDYVVVKKVVTEKEQITPDGSREYRPKGRYAFWVGSNNTKANIGRPDTHRNTPIADSGKGIWRLLHPQDVEPYVIDGIEEGQKNRDTRLLTPKSFTLVSESNRLGVLNNYHAMTGLSSSVLCNVRDGGLKKNLSAFLHNTSGEEPVDIKSLDSSQPHYIGVNRKDRLIGPPNEEYAALRGVSDYNNSGYQDVAPTFELLWHWAQLADKFSFGNSSSGIVLQKTSNAVKSSGGKDGYDDGSNLPLVDHETAFDSNVYDQQNEVPVDPRNLSKVKFAPVLVEACVYYNLATYKRSSGIPEEHVLRLCLYPRVGLWNPYNVDLKFDKPMVLQLFLNGHKSVIFDNNINFSREIHYGGPNKWGYWHNTLGGQVYFTLPTDGLTIPPGETFIFSMGGAPRPLDPIHFRNNVLQADEAPSASSYFYKDYTRDNLPESNKDSRAQYAQDSDDIKSEIMPTKPTTFRENPLVHVLGAEKAYKEHGADNYMFMLKYLEGNAANLEDFKEEPMIAYGGISLQAGGGEEYPIEWNQTDSNYEEQVIDIETAAGVISDTDDNIPNPYTRDGFRIRWLKETAANTGENIDSNSNTGRMLQSSALGNWNLRAAYICRNPFDNVTTTTPYFHGIYTRDNPSDEVNWASLTPVENNGKQTGFPFGKANFGVSSVVAFEVPTLEVGIPSLGYLRHLQLSEFVWHPSYSIGSSIADPRVETTGTVPNGDMDMTNHGWNKDGFAIKYWADLFRNIVFELCDDNHLIFDMSYEVNHNLWSDFFVTGATRNQMSNFAQDPVASPLKNGNFRLWDTHGDPTEDLNDLYRAAGRLMMDGGFDVHSTSKEAWKALLSSTRDTGYGSEDRTPFPRTLFPKGEENVKAEYSTKVFTGFRSLSDQEIDSFAEAIVREVKKRAPFFGMSDFVNRRLTADETGRNGAIEEALWTSKPNRGQIKKFPIKKEELRSETDFDAQPRDKEKPTVSDNTRLDQTLKPPSTGYGTPGYITQGDVLQVVGSALVARSDTFTVRSYGESVDVNGKVLARAWCEATVQRTPEPVVPDNLTGMNPKELDGDQVNFGRRFVIVGFRWLNADEV